MSLAGKSERNPLIARRYACASISRAKMAIALAFVLLSILLTGCASGNQASVVQGKPTARPSSTTSTPSYTPTINRPVATTGCGLPSPIAVGSSRNFTIPSNPVVSEGHTSRAYLLHVPLVYNPTIPIPVVMTFHGYGGDATGIESGTGFSPIADRENFLAVYPQGLLDENNGNIPEWASLGPLDYGIDDVVFVSDILNDLQRRFCVDPHRLYATGFSNGGGMAAFLACRLAGRMAAFAPVSGNMYAIPGGCNPGRSVPLLDFHGTQDHVLPYNGIPASIDPQWPLPAISGWLQSWATRDGCTRGPSIFLRQSNVTGMQWTNCGRGGVIVHYRIEGGGHSWPPTINALSASEVIWRFFQAHPLP